MCSGPWSLSEEDFNRSHEQGTVDLFQSLGKADSGILPCACMKSAILGVFKEDSPGCNSGGGGD